MTRSGLGRLVHWCVDSFASEAESAARWADCYMAVPDRAERARRMIGDLSARVVGAGYPRHFVEELPGVRGRLRTEAAYLVFRLVKIQLYVAAAMGHRMDDREALEAQSLLLLAMALGEPPEWRSQQQAESRLEEILDQRVAAVEALPHATAMLGAFEFLTLAAAADVAAAWFDDMHLSGRDLDALRRSSAERTAVVLGLLKLMARADGTLSRPEEGVLDEVARVLPHVDPADLRRAVAEMSVERLPEILPFAEERQGLLDCMLAVATADGRLAPEEEGLCREVARVLEIPDEEVTRRVARLPLLRS